MVGADFERLVTAHDQPSLAVLAVLEQPHVASAPLLPLAALTIELEQLRSHLERALLQLFICLGVNLLGQVYYRFEVNVGLFFSCLVVLQTVSVHIARDVLF